MSKGLRGEEMLSELIELFPKTFRKVQLKQSSRELVELALKYSPKKVSTLLKTQGYLIGNLIQQDPAWLLDHLFNCDLLVAVNVGGKGRLVAIDVTTNPEAVIEKEEKMKNSKSLLQAVGIELGLIVYWNLNSEDVLWDLSLSSTSEKELLKNWGRELWECVKMIDTSDSYAGTCILSR